MEVQGEPFDVLGGEIAFAVQEAVSRGNVDPSRGQTGKLRKAIVEVT